MKKLSEIKAWNAEIEEEISKEWKNSEKFNFNPDSKKKIYSIDTPPPYINDPIHIGHAVTYSLMDFFARYRRLKGYEVLFPLGLDRNGLPIEMATEKKFGVSAFDVGRKKFIEYCEKLLREASAESIDSFSKLGISFSSYKEGNTIGSIYNTDSPEYRKLTQKTFISLFKKGEIYEDNRINNWDPKLKTTIADSEIEYKEIESSYVRLKWRVKETGEEIAIATTRPELIGACGMVIFNPKDKRYSHLDGMTAIVPIYGYEVPIKAHPLAQIEKGTGIVMMCSAGDLSDIQFFREMGLKTRILINEEGKMNEKAGILKGLYVKEARKKITEIAKEKGLLEGEEKIKHRTPVSERSGAEIEFIEMPEFYLRQLDKKEEILKIIDDIDFYPESSKKILESWINSVSIDWPISRRRFYATPIPLWYWKDLVAVPSIDKYVEPWREGPLPEFEVLEKNSKRKIGKVEDFPEAEWVGEERVLDTWFDSSISELNMLKYSKDDEFFNRAYPASLRPQGKEIVRTWLYYTILRGYIETKKACFKDVWIHNHVLDSKGRKMSKSLGNTVDPHDILAIEGSEAFRLWCAVEGDISKGDILLSRERIAAEKKTINKFLNVSRFVLSFEKPSNAKLTEPDRIFLSFIDNLTNFCDESYKKYDFNKSSVKLRRFLWEIFASHYIEMVKPRAYNSEKKFSREDSLSARWALHEALKRLIILLYPIIPKVTSAIALEINFDIDKSSWPDALRQDKEAESKIDNLIKFNSFVWKKKKDSGKSLKEPIEGIKVPEELKEFEQDLISCHNLLNG